MGKRNYQAFVNAVRARGHLAYYDLGGGVDLAPTTTAPSGVGGSTTQGGIIGGLTPQSSFQAVLAPTTQLNYAPAVNQATNQALAGYGQTQQNIGQEQDLANTFLAEGRGQGPNPAQAQLAENTGTNVANQAALAAGQRGAASNVGLITRQAGQTGAAAQQTAVGQAATLQAQQELAAQQQAAEQQQAIGNQINAATSNATNLTGTAAGALNTQNADLVSNYGQAQGANAATAASNAQAAGKTSGGLLGGGAAAIAGLVGLAGGGEVPSAHFMPGVGNYANGGYIGQVAPMGNGPQSWAGRFLNSQNQGDDQDYINQGLYALGKAGNSLFKSPSTPPTSMVGDSSAFSSTGPGSLMAGGAGEAAAAPALADAAVLAAKGGKIPGKGKAPVIKDGNVPAMLSPGEAYVPPEKVNSPNPLKDAKRVPGEPKVKGDSLKNDTEPAMLKAGGVVIPNHIMQAKDAPAKAAAFVRAIQAKSRGKGAARA